MKYPPINHIAIIVDGNGRWAKNKGLSRSEGHKAGALNLEKLIFHISRKNIANVLSLYVFSTENFKRNKSEVDYLMNLFLKWFKKVKIKYKNENIKVVFSRDSSLLSKNINESINTLEEETKNNTGLIVNFCLGYGGRQEIVNAVKNISKNVYDNKLNIEDIDIPLVNKYMYQNLPDIDYLIRTSGELRISNFMLWQASYAEFYFPHEYFPDFDEKALDKAIEEYYNRDRRFGQIKST